MLLSFVMPAQAASSILGLGYLTSIGGYWIAPVKPGDDKEQE